jgi:hypothetical protein
MTNQNLLYLQSRNNVVAATKGTNDYDEIIKILQDKEEEENDDADHKDEEHEQVDVAIEAQKREVKN